MPVLNLYTFTKCQSPLATFKYLIFFKYFLVEDRLCKVNNDHLRSIIINVPYWIMINGTIQWLTKHVFSISLITRKCSVSHQEVKKINFFDKILGHSFFLPCWSQKHTLLSPDIWEKVVADNSKMASTITAFKNLQIFMQQVEFWNENWIFLWLLMSIP